MARHPLSRRTQRDRRHGTTVVETAFVLPVFLLFVFALIEFGHAVMVKNVLRSACRTGARVGSTEGWSTTSVEQLVRKVMQGAIAPETVNVMVKNAEVFDQGGDLSSTGQQLEALPDIELSDAEPRQLFMVRARVAFNDVALLPMPFLEGVVLEGQAFIRHE